MILIALGSNVSGHWGDPSSTLRRAIEEMSLQSIRIQKVSTFIETAPFGVTDQPSFINAVAKVKTRFTPEQLIVLLHQIEERAGRVRGQKWGPRTLDLDIIDYNGLVQGPVNNDTSSLTLPHPGIEERSFVLAPIAEIAPRWKHPISGNPAALTLRQLSALNAN
jgi:2-amino-4-hydroxy-6-hydroxymethyldihydropteridine diphosphokinase